MDHTRHCQSAVPDALRGSHGPATCNLAIGRDGTHDGDHKAHLTIRGVGKVVWRWKSKRKARPEVVLPTPHWNNAKARGSDGLI